MVSQLHRSPGAFFDESIHPNGKKLFAARIIPYHGSWVEFSLDVNDIMYVHIDRKRKIPVTVLLRAIGFSMTDVDPQPLLRQRDREGLKSAKRGKHPIVGRHCAQTVVDKSTGEILIEAGEEVTAAALEALKLAGVDKLGGHGGQARARTTTS